MRCTVGTAILPVLLLGMWMGPAAFGNRLTNGTFDASVPSNGTGGGWTSLHIGAGGWEAGGGNPGAFFALNNNGDVFDPTVLQSISGLSIGTTYYVEGDYKLNLFAGGNAADSFEVRLNNVPLLTVGPPGPLGFWGSFATSFVATSATHQISFVAETYGSNHDYGVDNLSVRVPEPASAWLAAIAMLGVLRRRLTGASGARTAIATSTAATF